MNFSYIFQNSTNLILHNNSIKITLTHDANLRTLVYSKYKYHILDIIIINYYVNVKVLLKLYLWISSSNVKEILKPFEK